MGGQGQIRQPRRSWCSSLALGGHTFTKKQHLEARNCEVRPAGRRRGATEALFVGHRFQGVISTMMGQHGTREERMSIMWG